MSRLMNAISSISDRHIIEFASACSYKKKTHSWKLVAAVACLLLAAIAIPTSLILTKQTAKNISSTPNPNAFPYVIVNGINYLYDDFTPLTELPEGYIAIGSVISNDPSDQKKEGFSSGCKVGDIIYQNPSDTSEVFVYTKLFSGNGYWYLRFVQL